MCNEILIGLVQKLVFTLHCLLLFCSYSCIITWNDDGLKGEWRKQFCNLDLYSYFSQGKHCSSDFHSIWPFLKVFHCFGFLTSRMLLLAPFINFRSLPRDGAKEPWDEIRPLWFYIYRFIGFSWYSYQPWCGCTYKKSWLRMVFCFLSEYVGKVYL